MVLLDEVWGEVVRVGKIMMVEKRREIEAVIMNDNNTYNGGRG